MAKATSTKTKSTAPTRPVAEEQSYAWVAWAIAALAFFLYLPGFRNAMVSMDDHSATVDNLAVTQFAPFSHFHNLGMYAPITWLFYAIAYKLGGDAPVWYHIFSALAHALNTWLLYRLVSKLHSDWQIAAMAAALFAVHPLQVEAVAWIAGFSTPLFVCFFLMGLNVWVSRPEGDKIFSRPYLLVLGAFLLAALSKSAAVTFPLALLVIDAWRGKNWRSSSALLEKAPFFLLSLLFGWLTLQTRDAAGHSLATSATEFSMIDRLYMVSHTILFYWGKFLAPFGLSIWYPFQKMDGQWHWSYYAAPLALLAVVGAAWYFRRQARLLWYALLFYLANIVVALPFATFGTFELRSDRYNYLAGIGIFVLLAALPGWLGQKRPALVQPARIAVGLLALLWIGLSYVRITEWSSTVKLIDKAIAAQGDNHGKAYLWRGMELGNQGKMQDALQDFTKAIETDSNLVDAYKYRGGIMGLARRYDQSVADLSKYLQYHPEAAEQFFNRGLSYTNLGENEKALADFNKTLELNPDFYRAYNARGNVYLAMGDTEKGNADLRQYQALDAKAKAKAKQKPKANRK